MSRHDRSGVLALLVLGAIASSVAVAQAPRAPDAQRDDGRASCGSRR